MGCHTAAQTSGTMSNGQADAGANFSYLLQAANPGRHRRGERPGRRP